MIIFANKFSLTSDNSLATMSYIFYIFSDYNFFFLQETISADHVHIQACRLQHTIRAFTILPVFSTARSCTYTGMQVAAHKQSLHHSTSVLYCQIMYIYRHAGCSIQAEPSLFYQCSLLPDHVHIQACRLQRTSRAFTIPPVFQA